MSDVLFTVLGVSYYGILARLEPGVAPSPYFWTVEKIAGDYMKIYNSNIPVSNRTIEDGMEEETLELRFLESMAELSYKTQSTKNGVLEYSYSPYTHMRELGLYNCSRMQQHQSLLAQYDLLCLDEQMDYTMGSVQCTDSSSYCATDECSKLDETHCVPLVNVLDAGLRYRETCAYDSKKGMCRAIMNSNGIHRPKHSQSLLFLRQQSSTLPYYVCSEHRDLMIVDAYTLYLNLLCVDDNLRFKEGPSECTSGMCGVMSCDAIDPEYCLLGVDIFALDGEVLSSCRMIDTVCQEISFVSAYEKPGGSLSSLYLVQQSSTYRGLLACNMSDKNYYNALCDEGLEVDCSLQSENCMAESCASLKLDVCSKLGVQIDIYNSNDTLVFQCIGGEHGCREKEIVLDGTVKPERPYIIQQRDGYDGVIDCSTKLTKDEGDGFEYDVDVDGDSDDVGSDVDGGADDEEYKNALCYGVLDEFDCRGNAGMFRSCADLQLVKHLGSSEPECAGHEAVDLYTQIGGEIEKYITCKYLKVRNIARSYEYVCGAVAFVERPELKPPISRARHYLFQLGPNTEFFECDQTKNSITGKYDIDYENYICKDNVDVYDCRGVGFHKKLCDIRSCDVLDEDTCDMDVYDINGNFQFSCILKYGMCREQHSPVISTITPGPADTTSRSWQSIYVVAGAALLALVL